MKCVSIPTFVSCDESWKHKDRCRIQRKASSQQKDWSLIPAQILRLLWPWLGIKQQNRCNILFFSFFKVNQFTSASLACQLSICTLKICLSVMLHSTHLPPLPSIRITPSLQPPPSIFYPGFCSFYSWSPLLCHRPGPTDPEVRDTACGKTMWKRFHRLCKWGC